MMKECTKCKIKKSIHEFSYKSKASETFHKQCKVCTRVLVKNHYYSNKDYYLKKAHKRNKELRLETFAFLKDYLTKNPCVDCGERDITVLEFDHNGKLPKYKAVSVLMKNRVRLDMVKKEISKCDVRCANCHRRKTARDFNWIKIMRL